MPDPSRPNETSMEGRDPDDGLLLQRFRAGSEDAATALYLRYAKRLRLLADSRTSGRMAVEVDAEGIVQSVFRTFFRRAGMGQYDVDDSDSLWKLLLVIAMNKIRSRATFHSAAKRDAGRNVRLGQLAESAHPLQGSDAEALSILKWTIDELLEEMPRESHEIVLMRMDGRSVAEIAEATGRSKRTVERTLQNFRKTLGEQLDFEP